MTGSRFVFGVFGACILLIVWNLALFQFFSAELAAVRRRVTMVEDAMQGFDGLLHASAPHNAAVRLPGSLDAQPPRRSDTDNHNDSNHDAESSVRTNSHQAHSELRNNAAPVAPHAAAGPTIPVLVLCYNRAKYLNRTLSTLFANIDLPQRHPVYVSQDGTDAAVATVARSFPIARLFQRTDRTLPKLDKGPGAHYYHIALHYKFALSNLFELRHPPAVVILEEDMDVARDCLAYFRAMLPLLERDPTLLAASAFNDNGGTPRLVADPLALHRSDFFPGLGWLLTASLWHELAPKWPIGFWDDWLREPAQRQGRATIRPELSRTHTFGAVGSSGGQFYAAHLAHNRISDGAANWARFDIAQLHKATYDAQLRQLIDAAEPIHSVTQIAERSGATLLLRFTSMAAFVQHAKALKIMSDEKAGVPRTSYNGVVMVRLEARQRDAKPNLILLQDQRFAQR